MITAVLHSAVLQLHQLATNWETLVVNFPPEKLIPNFVDLHMIELYVHFIVLLGMFGRC